MTIRSQRMEAWKDEVLDHPGKYLADNGLSVSASKIIGYLYASNSDAYAVKAICDSRLPELLNSVQTDGFDVKDYREMADLFAWWDLKENQGKDTDVLVDGWAKVKASKANGHSGAVDFQRWQSKVAHCDFEKSRSEAIEKAEHDSRIRQRGERIDASS